MFDTERYTRLRKLYNKFKSEKETRIPALYEKNLKEHGTPRWYKRKWIVYWLDKNALWLLFAYVFATWLIRDIGLELLGWLILIAIPGIPLLLGALFGHFIWK